MGKFGNKDNTNQDKRELFASMNEMSIVEKNVVDNGKFSYWNFLKI